MKKRNGNTFIDKFNFLHSQESSEEITWSGSDASDYENGCRNKHCETLTNGTNNNDRKRKRTNKRKKECRNISNLNFTAVDTNSKPESSVNNSKSPILIVKSRSEVKQKYPVTKQKVHNNAALTSLSSLNPPMNNNNILKSPIMVPKMKSPIVSPNVKRKLFTDNKCHANQNEAFECTGSISPILNKKNNCIYRKQCLYAKNNTEQYNIKNYVKEQNNYTIDDQTDYNVRDRCKGHDEISIGTIQCLSSEENVSKKLHTIAKTKPYFDNYFTSETSQSISECETPTPEISSETSYDIDISTPKTQEKIIITSPKETCVNKSKKKVKLRKGGLADRLNLLLKQQNISITLWQHEKFLAENSDFVIPKQKYLVFRIKNVFFKYGIYLLSIVNEDDEIFIVIINSFYVNNNSFEINSVLKIYEPYKIVNVSKDTKFIFNVCKFECEKLMI